MSRLRMAVILLAISTVSTARAAEEPPPQYQDSWGSYGSDPGQFAYPTGLATDAAGNLYVVDLWNENVQKFSGDGSFQTSWGTGELGNPRGIDVGPGGNVYVADSYRIVKYTSGGGFVVAWGDSGSGDLEFDLPADVAVDGDGNIYVSDTNNNRIEKLDSSGGFVSSWGGPGSGVGQFDTPQGIAVDPDGNIYVADLLNSRVQKLTPEGSASVFVSAGTTEGNVRYPSGVATDGAGNVYVLDRGTCDKVCRVQKFSPAGTVLSIWGSDATGCSGDDCNGKFQTALDVGVSFDGSAVFVSDLSPRVQLFSSTVSTRRTTWGRLKTLYP